MLARLLVLVALVSPQMLSGGSRPADIAFRVQMIDPGFSESVAVADFNKDGRLDILSAEYWYASPGWTKNKIRDIPFNGSYIDNFSDLPVDVDGDGYTDIIQIAYFARRIVWLKNPAKGRGPWVETEIDTVGPTEFAFLVDLNDDGQPDLIAAKRYFGRGGADPSEREPMGIYWYQFRPGPKGTVEWIRHIIDYGGRAGGGLQMVVEDIDADGDRDVITSGKTGLFLSENLRKGARAPK